MPAAMGESLAPSYLALLRLAQLPQQSPLAISEQCRANQTEIPDLEQGLHKLLQRLCLHLRVPANYTWQAVQSISVMSSHFEGRQER